MLVVHEKRPIVVRPARLAIRSWDHRPVFQLVVHWIRQVLRQIHRRSALHVGGEPCPFVTVPPGDEPRARRQLRRCLNALRDQVAFPRCHVDQIDVVVAGSVPRDLLAVGNVRDRDSTIGVALGANRNARDRCVRQLHDALTLHVQNRAIRPLEFALALQQLLRLQQRIAPVPDVQLHFLPFRDLCFRFRIRTRRRAEEQTTAVIGKRRGTMLAHPPPAGNARSLMIHHRARFVRPVPPVVQ